MTRSAVDSGVLKSKFSGFMSISTRVIICTKQVMYQTLPLWTILLLCRYSSPFKTDRITAMASFSVNLPLSNNRSNNSPPVALFRNVLCYHSICNHRNSQDFCSLQFKHQVELFSGLAGSLEWADGLNMLCLLPLPRLKPIIKPNNVGVR